jgi:hypothetical protein
MTRGCLTLISLWIVAAVLTPVVYGLYLAGLKMIAALLSP